MPVRRGQREKSRGGSARGEVEEDLGERDRSGEGPAVVNAVDRLSAMLWKLRAAGDLPGRVPRQWW